MLLFGNISAFLAHRGGGRGWRLERQQQPSALSNLLVVGVTHTQKVAGSTASLTLQRRPNIRRPRRSNTDLAKSTVARRRRRSTGLDEFLERKQELANGGRRPRQLCACLLARSLRPHWAEHARLRCSHQGACTQNTRELLLLRVARDSRAARGREKRGGLFNGGDG